MADSPAKRRKISPTTSHPIDAPSTPSRIPVRRDGAQTTPARPSFASPTKASLARHNPQLLNRPSSSGSTERPSSRGALDGMFGNTLGEATPLIEGWPVITGEDRLGPSSNSFPEGNEHQGIENQRAITPKSRGQKALGGALSAKPRRMSRSPIKRVEKDPVGFTGRNIEQEITEGANPFQKKGLRRTPPPVESATETHVEAIAEDHVNPFQKRGLRRSPVQQAVEDVEHPSIKATRKPEVSTTPTGPVPPHTGFAEVTKEIQKQEMTGNAPTPDQQEAHSAAAEAILPNGTRRTMSPAITPRPASRRKPPGVAEIISSRRTLRSASPAVAGLSTQRKVLEVPEIISSNRPLPQAEPELPPTPTQLGIPDPIVTSPATGIHDTPSKRARKSRALGEKLKSSPLKPQDPPPKEPFKEKEPAKEPEPETRLQGILLTQPQSQPGKPPKRRKSARFLIPEDPYASKKKQRDDLLRELQQLQADVALANQENERLHSRPESKKKGSTVAPNPDSLLAMLQRATAPEPSESPKPKPASIFKSMHAFLPFGPRRKPPPLPVSEKALPSYLPVPLDNPLPYLQAFTPLTYTSTISLHQSPPNLSSTTSDDTDAPLFQKHTITASHPSGLFTSRLSMLVNTSSLTIADLSVLRLDMNAETELGTFIRARAKADSPLGKDVSVICWAMGRWIEVSIKRASFWCTVESELGSAEKRRSFLQRKRKRKRLGSIVDDHEDSEAEGENAKPKWTRKQLLPYIGRSSMELANDNVEVRFEWKIAFDWTGEVESSISAAARIPRSWHQKDDRESLAKLPDTFDRLLKDRGPIGAVRAVVGLLMSTS